MIILQVFHKSNTINRRIQNELFYNSSIRNFYESQSAEIEEYIQFKLFLQESYNFVFTFCNYPFVIDVQYKVQILEIESRSEQNERQRKIRN